VLGRPQGLKGTKLELDSLFITTFDQHVTDLIHAIEQVGIYVEDVIASPLAASFVLLSNAQKRAGCVLINIGSETTSMVVFEDLTPISLKIFPVGSNDITNDIALELRIPPEDAERVKRGAMTSVTVTKKRLDQIIDARLTKIYELIELQLMKIKRDGLLPAGAILTGGGAAAAHAADIAKDVLKLPARVATLEIGKTTKVRDSSWAVAYGLCMWGASDREEHTTLGIVRQTKRSIFSWFNQFLP
jgi:cell division protein FtsA